MKKNFLISVIVPVFNAEEHISMCIESIINQSYYNIEIILIDDGSNDKSFEICKKYSEIDNRVRAYKKENGGTSSARNYGLNMAKGDYFGFVDSDDFIDKDMYNRLLNVCVNNNKDIACCNKVRVFKNKKISENIKYKKNDLNNEEAYGIIMKYDPSVCNKLFKKSLFSNIRFNEKNYYEDIDIMPRLIKESNGMFLINYDGYFYIQRENSKVNDIFNIKQMDYFYNTIKIEQDFTDGKYADLKDKYEYMIILTCISLLNHIYPVRKEYKKEYLIVKKKLLEYKKRIHKNGEIPFYKKIMAYMYIMNLDILVFYVRKILK